MNLRNLHWEDVVYWIGMAAITIAAGLYHLVMILVFAGYMLFGLGLLVFVAIILGHGWQVVFP